MFFWSYHESAHFYLKVKPVLKGTMVVRWAKMTAATNNKKSAICNRHRTLLHDARIHYWDDLMRECSEETDDTLKQGLITWTIWWGNAQKKPTTYWCEDDDLMRNSQKKPTDDTITLSAHFHCLAAEASTRPLPKINCFKIHTVLLGTLKLSLAIQSKLFYWLLSVDSPHKKQQSVMISL